MNILITQKKRELASAIAVLILIVVIVTSAATTNPKKSAVVKHASVQLSKTKSTPGSAYKNGVFTGSGSYDSPGGPESFTLKVTLTNDIITDTSAVSGSNDDTSRIYQQQFISGYKQLVVGKKITAVKLGAVSGSSLTAQGFNQALEQIKKEAQQG